MNTIDDLPQYSREVIFEMLFERIISKELTAVALNRFRIELKEAKDAESLINLATQAADQAKSGLVGII